MDDNRTPAPVAPPPLELLVVDEDFADVVLIREVTAEARHRRARVTHVARLSQALASLRARRFDVVVLSLSLPDAPGTDAVQRLLAECPGAPPVVALTDASRERDAWRAVEAGAQDYLLGGQIERRILLRTLQSAIDRHGLARELDRTRRREQFLATHHPLTRLPNHALFRDRLAQSLASARRHGHRLALMALDVGRLRAINESWGHAAGDRVLREVGRRLGRSLRSTDTAAHVAADEFAVILNGIARDVDAAVVARALLDSLARPVPLEGAREIALRPSIGISLYPDDARSAGELLRHADAALERAKRSGRRQHFFFARGMLARAREQIGLEADLQRALEGEELRIAYQPVVDGRTGEIVAAEALLRWQHPERGALPPAQFVPLAERTGAIQAIGSWVLRQACATVADWQLAGLPRIALRVNVSASQLRHGDLADVVAKTLLECCLDAADLELEIGARCLLEDADAALETLRRVAAIGVRVSLDDFGTGPAPLDALKRLPLGTLELGRSLVAGCASDPDDARMVAAVIALARELGAPVLAEGVEREEQRRFLLERGCHAMQGFLFSPPLAPSELRGLLEGKRARPG